MKRIVGLAAKARSGKDTAAKMLLAHPEVAAYALADPLKEGCKALFGLTARQAWDDTVKEQVLNAWGRSPRQFFQRVGTEWMRGHDPLHWLKRADREINDPPSLIQSASTSSAFAESDRPFAQSAQAIFGLSDRQLQPEAYRLEVDELWGMTPLQMVELIRGYAYHDFPEFQSQRADHISGNAEAEAEAEAKLHPKANFDGKKVIVIKDIRFENEAEYIRSLGGEIWHIVRPDADRVNSHSSEAGIKTAVSDVVILNSGTLEDYKSEVKYAWERLIKRLA